MIILLKFIKVLEAVELYFFVLKCLFAILIDNATLIGLLIGYWQDFSLLFKCILYFAIREFVLKNY